jgi:site-specific DNA-methyltransferase (adenine-specific)
MDRGIDGYLRFRDADKNPQFAIISVKGGRIKSGGRDQSFPCLV